MALVEQEEADRIAKEAAKECGELGVPINLGIVKAALKARHREELLSAIPKDHAWREATGGKAPKHSGLTRARQRLLAQLRAGHCPVTRDYLSTVAKTKKMVAVPGKGDVGLTVRNLIVTDVRAETPAARHGIEKGWHFPLFVFVLFNPINYLLPI